VDHHDAPGVVTPGGSRDSQINGLPQSAINITWDGVNVQDNHNKTGDGFFAIISPRLDAIEEVTLTTAAQGAEATGQGAARINFVTRSGSNTYTGSAYHYFRHDALNTNTWSRNRDQLPKANLLQNQPGIRFGGPIQIPGLRRSQQGVLLRQLRRVPPAGRVHGDEDDSPSARAAGHLPLQHGEWRSGSGSASTRAEQRSSGDDGSHRRQTPRRHPGLDQRHRHDYADDESEP
jgi:hypothetical protein